MPFARRSLTAAAAVRAAAVGLVRVAWDCSGAANGMLRISPPSWSVAIRALPFAAFCIPSVIAFSVGASGAFLAKRITPLPWPSRRRRRM